MNMKLHLKNQHKNITNDSYKGLIAVERKSRELSSDTLLNDIDNIQRLLSFDIEEQLPIVLSGEQFKR